jgi:hypothetical protein
VTTILPIPVDRYLVPADAAPGLPADAVQVHQPLLRGLPATFALDNELGLALFVPTGDALLWRDADAGALIAAGSEERAPRAPDDREDPVARPPARLVLRRGTTLLAEAPLRAGLTWRMPDDGGGSQLIELWILDYALHAGTLRELGDFGSFVDFAWRRIDRGTDQFTLPALDPRVAERFSRRVESQLGGAP